MSIPSPFIFTKDGLSYRVELDYHYISDEEMQTLSRYITTLNDENAKLREMLVGAFEDMDAWQKVIAGSNEWGYGKGCLDRLCKLKDAMQELGMEVEVR